jgi:hypothetical protein
MGSRRFPGCYDDRTLSALKAFRHVWTEGVFYDPHPLDKPDVQLIQRVKSSH